MAQLAVALPGFSETTVHITPTQACVTSVLRKPSSVHQDCLTAYRYCALVEFDDRISSVGELLQGVSPNIRDLSGSGIAALLRSVASVAVLRVLDQETYAVLQLISSSDPTWTVKLDFCL